MLANWIAIADAEPTLYGHAWRQLDHSHSVRSFFPFAGCETAYWRSDVLTAAVMFELFVLALTIGFGYLYAECVNEHLRLPSIEELLAFRRTSERAKRNTRAVLLLSVVFLLLAVVALLVGVGKVRTHVWDWREWATALVGPTALIFAVPVLTLRISSGILRLGNLLTTAKDVPIVSVGRLVLSGGWCPDNLGMLRSWLVVFQILFLLTGVSRIILLLMDN